MILFHFKRKKLTLIKYPILFFVLMTFIGFSSWATTIEVSQSDASSLQSIINDNNTVDGDVLFFNEEGVYDLGNRVIVLDKALTLQGLDPIGFEESEAGASGIRTTLKNPVSIIIASDNITIKNLKLEQDEPSGNENFSILLDGRTKNYKDNFRNPEGNNGDTWSGITLDNVELNGGFYNCFSGNGLEGTFVHVSFVNYRRIGYIMDRRAPISLAPEVTFDFCYFEPRLETLGFDNRGISLDAGNTEYPLVWDFNESVLKNSKFINTGIALSRCQNFVIMDNVFDDFEGKIDLVHIEEWSNNVTVTGNTFNCQSPSPSLRTRVMQFDRELQRSNFINVNNNVVTGTFNFFINAYGGNDISINNNDFTNSNAVNILVSFDFYESRTKEPIQPFQEFVSFNMEVLDNVGFDDANPNSIIDVRMHVPSSGGNININNASQTDLQVTSFPRGLIDDGTYEIINEENGRKLASIGSSSELTTAPSSTNDNSVKWDVAFEAPYYFNFKNRDNELYMETHKGYTEAEILGEVTENVRPFLADQGYRPRWSLVETSSEDVYEIFTGGNEKQSALAPDTDNGVQLIFGKRFLPNFSREPVNFTDRAKWKFVRLADIDAVIADVSNDVEQNRVFEVSPNPAYDVISIRYENALQSVSDIQLINMRGEVVKSGRLYSHAINGIDTSGLPRGVYVVKTSVGHYEKVILQ